MGDPKQAQSMVGIRDEVFTIRDKQLIILLHKHKSSDTLFYVENPKSRQNHEHSSQQIHYEWRV